VAHDERLPDSIVTHSVWVSCGRTSHKPGCSIIFRYAVDPSKLPAGFKPLERADIPRDVDPSFLLVSYEHTKVPFSPMADYDLRSFRIEERLAFLEKKHNWFTRIWHQHRVET